MNANLSPYLTFKDQAKQAMEFYKSILGGELKMQSFGESGIPVSDEEKDLIIHADLEAEGIHFYASDGGSQHPVQMGDNMSLCLQGQDEQTLTKWFSALSEGGKVDMPLSKQFWGDTYGQLTDKFGIHWMVNISAAQTPEQK